MDPATTTYRDTVQAGARSPWRLTAIALVLAILIGSVLGGWLALRFLADDGAEPQAELAKVQAPLAATPALLTDGRLVAAPPITSVEAGAMAARVSLLEERLARISMAAESASGNAAKAEALLVAFAARRALDRGLPLGPMEAQVRLRFGETQPNAVDSILSASANPITQEELLQRLKALRPVLVTDGGAGWLRRIGNGLSSLVVIRSSDTPSPAPTRRYDRARRAIEDGRIDNAIVEVEALPGLANPLVQGWLTDARRYNDARRSLDLIETAAILEPGQNREPALSSAPVPAR